MASTQANDTTIYYELRGDGPSLLLISGATGDAGHWAGVADILADEYSVITYDRRGNSRSPRPPGWTSTTVDEQADDAAALLRELNQTPAVVFGTSSGGTIAVNLMIRHSSVLRGVGFHEPLLLSGVSNAAGIRTHRAALIEEGRSRIRAATEDFLLGVVGKETYESLDPDLRERLLRNGDVLLNIETMPCLDYEPTATELASVRVPVLVIASANNCHANAPGYWRYQAAAHLASQLGAPLVELPGMHTSYLAQPRVFAEALRPHLATLT